MAHFQSPNSYAYELMLQVLNSIQIIKNQYENIVSTAEAFMEEHNRSALLVWRLYLPSTELNGILCSIIKSEVMLYALTADDGLKEEIILSFP